MDQGVASRKPFLQRKRERGRKRKTSQGVCNIYFKCGELSPVMWYQATCQQKQHSLTFRDAPLWTATTNSCTTDWTQLHKRARTFCTPSYSSWTGVTHTWPRTSPRSKRCLSSNEGSSKNIYLSTSSACYRLCFCSCVFQREKLRFGCFSLNNLQKREKNKQNTLKCTTNNPQCWLKMRLHF